MTKRLCNAIILSIEVCIIKFQRESVLLLTENFLLPWQKSALEGSLRTSLIFTFYDITARHSRLSLICYFFFYLVAHHNKFVLLLLLGS